MKIENLLVNGADTKTGVSHKDMTYVFSFCRKEIR